MGARWSADPATSPTSSTGENDSSKYKEPMTPATNGNGLQKPNVFSKDTLEFVFGMGSDGGAEGSDEIVITNHKAMKLKYKVEAAPSTQCVITASPSTGSIAPGKDKKVKLKADVKDKVNLTFKLTVHVGIEAHFLNVRVRSVTGVFGTDPTTLDMVEDEDLMVPEILVLMKRSLIASDGLKSEGIFRLAGDVFEIAQLKDQMNKKTFQKSDNVNTVATLIKVWYRELPEPILNKVPTESIYYSSDADRCIEAYRDLQEPFKTLLTWLLDLLCSVTQHSAVNRMTPQNLAIVVAPNLYDTSSSDPMEGLVMSQKVVQFVNHLLLWYLERKTGSIPSHTPAASIPIRNPETSSAVNSLLLSNQTPQRPKSPAKRRLTRNQTEGGAAAVVSRSGDSSSGNLDSSSHGRKTSSGSGSPRPTRKPKSPKEASAISILSPNRQPSSGSLLSSSNPELRRTDSGGISVSSQTDLESPKTLSEPLASPVAPETPSGPREPTDPGNTPSIEAMSTTDGVTPQSSSSSLNVSNATATTATVSPSPSTSTVVDQDSISERVPSVPGDLPTRQHSLSSLPPPATPPAPSVPSGTRPSAGSFGASGTPGSPRSPRMMSPRGGSFSISRPAPPNAPFPNSAPGTPTSPRVTRVQITPLVTPTANPTVEETSTPAPDPARTPRDGASPELEEAEASPRLLDDFTTPEEDDQLANLIPSPIPSRLTQLPPPSPAMSH